MIETVRVDYSKNLTKVTQMFSARGALQLDLGCGGTKQQGFVGIDARAVDGVDVVWDLEWFPWPVPDDCCSLVLCSHLVEHIKPWHSLEFFNEVWRCCTVGGTLMIATPYAGSDGYWQDPTHCNPFNQVTFQYFDPHYPLWNIYRPKPWKIEGGFPAYEQNGNLECLLRKLEEHPDDPAYYFNKALAAGAKHLQGLQQQQEESKPKEVTQDG